MIPDEAPLHDRGHNQPPGLLPLEQAVLELHEMLKEKTFDGKTFADRKEEFLRAARNAVVRNRDSAGAAADVIKMAAQVWSRLEAERLARSNPYRNIADALVRTADKFWTEVVDAMDGLKDKIDAWTDIEDKRIADQQREQEEEMAKLRGAAAPIVHVDERDAYPLPASPRVSVDYTAPFEPKPSPAPVPMQPAKRKRIRGDLGGMVSIKTETIYSVADVRALPDYILNAPGVHEAIIAAVKGTVKVMGVPAGIATSTVQANQIK